ncbi:MAG: hypothetical protein P4M09_26390 [Devosia sp.]|nr:hypothetical protein [Devosia sp.]
MSTKQHSSKAAADEAGEVFRQFAWHLAGSLAAANARSGPGGRAPKPAKGAVKR